MDGLTDAHEQVDWLVLFPTELERSYAAATWPKDRFEIELTQKVADKQSVEVAIEICGFGIVASAARTMQLIEKHKPRFVLLTGIAGTYRDQLDVGQAFEFDHVACYGIGVGTGNSFLSANKLGWPQWPGNNEVPSIEDRIRVGIFESDREVSSSSLQILLTVPSASASDVEVQDKLACFPNATAEDMEGFAVAAACRLAGVLLTIIRGISNVAGDRDKSRWEIEKAIEVAVELSHQKIGGAKI